MGLSPLLYADSPSGLNKDIFNKALPITVHHGMLDCFWAPRRVIPVQADLL